MWSQKNRSPIHTTRQAGGFQIFGFDAMPGALWNALTQRGDDMEKNNPSDHQKVVFWKNDLDISLNFHPGPPDLFWKIYRKYHRMFQSTWMTECFGQLGMFCNLKRRWNADPWNFRNFRSMIQGRRPQGCTVSHGASHGERWIPLPGDGRRGNQLLQHSWHSWHHWHQGLLCACPLLRLGELDRTVLGCDVVMLWIGKAM